jgi:two-component system, cell cycle sensor histidine kinase and response regulator CckA
MPGAFASVSPIPDFHGLIFSQASDGIFVADPSGHYVAVNPSGCRMLDYADDELLGKPIASICLTEDLNRLAESVALLKQGQRLLMQWRLVRRDGKLIDSELMAQALPGGYLMAIVRDLSERQRAEAALRDSEARFKAIVELTPNVAIQVFDGDARVTGWNRASERMFGFSAEEALGKTLDQLIHTPEEAAVFRGLLANIARTGQGIGPAEYSFRRKDGSSGWCLSTTFGIPTGDRLSFICMDVDLTAHKEADEKLLQAQKLEGIGRLAGGIAHDFNNLLTTISGFAELAMLRCGTDTVLSDQLRHIQNAASRGANLTQQLLAYARRKVISPEVLDVNAVVKELEPMLLRLIGERVRWEFHPGAAAHVRIDRGSLEQVIVNLVVNGRDSMTDGGLIKVAVGSAPAGASLGQDWVTLLISDTGTGISENVIGSIFEPFFTTKAQGKGTGLGLAVCHGIVTQAGGNIEVQSEVGAGTIVRIHLPGTAAMPESEAAAVPAAIDITGTETILFVEDDAMIVGLAEQALGELGYTMLRAMDGEEAIALLKGHDSPVHLLVTDMVMPGIGGRELATHLRNLRPGLKVLATSGYSDSLSAELDSTIHFLQKPYSLQDLARAIRTVLGTAAAAE